MKPNNNLNQQKNNLLYFIKKDQFKGIKSIKYQQLEKDNKMVNCNAQFNGNKEEVGFNLNQAQFQPKYLKKDGPLDQQDFTIQ